ncbi:hypothetical protein BC827DRAFT_1252279 [Russula dissimulans]|nr:hypothetical protein BC827DRAFT_1252279 [Russula dissimulans]
MRGAHVMWGIMLVSAFFFFGREFDVTTYTRAQTSDGGERAAASDGKPRTHAKRSESIFHADLCTFRQVVKVTHRLAKRLSMAYFEVGSLAHVLPGASMGKAIHTQQGDP